MRQPEFLKKGEKIAMVAPSFGVTTEPYLTRYTASRKNLEKEGFVIRKVPASIWKKGSPRAPRPNAGQKKS